MLTAGRTQTALDRDQTDHPKQLLTVNPLRAMVKVNGQSVKKIEWKQTDGHTDGADCINFLAKAFGKIMARIRLCDTVHQNCCRLFLATALLVHRQGTAIGQKCVA